MDQGTTQHQTKPFLNCLNEQQTITYGWSQDISALARRRNEKEALVGRQRRSRTMYYKSRHPVLTHYLGSVQHIPHGTSWHLVLAPGVYRVTAVLGDPCYPSVKVMEVNGLALASKTDRSPGLESFATVVRMILTLTTSLFTPPSLSLSLSFFLSYFLPFSLLLLYSFFSLFHFFLLRESGGLITQHF